MHLHGDDQRVVPDPVRHSCRRPPLPREPPRPRLPAMDALVPAARVLPDLQRGVLAAVQPLAAPVVRSRRSALDVVRGVRGRGRRGVRDPLPMLLPGLRGGRFLDSRGTVVRGRGAPARGGPDRLLGDLGPRRCPHAGLGSARLATARRGRAGACVNLATQADPRIRDGLRESLWAFGGARLLLFVISVAGGGTLALPPGQPPTDAGIPAPNLLPGLL